MICDEVRCGEEEEERWGVEVEADGENEGKERNIFERMEELSFIHQDDDKQKLEWEEFFFFI